MARKSSAPAKKAPRAPSRSQKLGSSTAEHSPDKREVAGSTPAQATKRQRDSSGKAEQRVHTPQVGRSNRPPATTTVIVDSDARPTAGLTPLQERFVLEYVKDFNGTQAYLRANPGTTERSACTLAVRLLANVGVRAAVQAHRSELAQGMVLDAERTRLEIARLAYFDPRKLLDAKGNPKPVHELDDDTAAVIAGMDVQQIDLGSAESPIPAVIKKYKLADKKGALDMAAKILGLYGEHNRQLTDPLTALLDGMKRSTLPVAATPPKDKP